MKSNTSGGVLPIFLIQVSTSAKATGVKSSATFLLRSTNSLSTTSLGNASR